MDIAGESVIAIQFLGQSGGDTADQTLLAVTNKGTLIVIRNMNIDAICTAASNKSPELPALLQRLQVQKSEIPTQQQLSHVRFFPSDAESTTTAFLTNTNGDLYSADILTNPSLSVSSARKLGALHSGYCLAKPGSAGPTSTHLVLAITEDQAVSTLGTAIDTPAAHCSLAAPADLLTVLVEESVDGLAVCLVLAAQSQVTATGASEAAQLLLLLRSGTEARLLHLGSSALPTGQLFFDGGKAATAAALFRCLTVDRDTASLLEAASGVPALWDQIRGAVRSGMSADSSRVREKGLASLIHIALLSLGAVPCTAAACEQGVRELAEFSTGPEVATALPLLLSFPSPPAGHIEKTLTSAEVTHITCTF
jgi:hypothetical protein